jgi:hypothetical protein
MIRKVEILRHTPQDLSVLFDTAAQGHSLEISFQGVSPLMIRADELAPIAITVATEAHSTMRADVLEDAYDSIFTSHHQYGSLADGGALEVAGAGYFRFQADITPMLFVKEAFELALV